MGSSIGNDKGDNRVRERSLNVWGESVCFRDVNCLDRENFRSVVSEVSGVTKRYGISSQTEVRSGGVLDRVLSDSILSTSYR